jgi:hypothetical protein
VVALVLVHAVGASERWELPKDLMQARRRFQVWSKHHERATTFFLKRYLTTFEPEAP